MLQELSRKRPRPGAHPSAYKPVADNANKNDAWQNAMDDCNTFGITLPRKRIDVYRCKNKKMAHRDFHIKRWDIASPNPRGR